jgi:hypothetical protein
MQPPSCYRENLLDSVRYSFHAVEKMAVNQADAQAHDPHLSLTYSGR